jgi:hypothetical protein
MCSLLEHDILPRLHAYVCACVFSWVRESTGPCVHKHTHTHLHPAHARMHARPSISTGVGIADTVRCGGRVYVRCVTRARERCFEVAMRRSRKHRAGGRWWESCNIKPNHPRRSSIRPSCATVRRVSALEGRSVIREQRGKATCSRVSHDAPRPARVSREAPRPARRNVCSGSRWHTVHTAFTAASSGVTPSRCVAPSLPVCIDPSSYIPLQAPSQGTANKDTANNDCVA